MLFRSLFDRQPRDQQSRVIENQPGYGVANIVDPMPAALRSAVGNAQQSHRQRWVFLQLERERRRRDIRTLRKLANVQRDLGQRRQYQLVPGEGIENNAVETIF